MTNPSEEVMNLDDVLYQIERGDMEKLTDDDWLVIIQALESYKELITNNG